MTASIGRDELQGKLDRGDHFRLVEVLAEDSFRRAHLPGAINLPPNQVHDRAKEILDDRNEEIVVYCGSSACPASAEAARDLEQQGYTHVRRYAGGKSDWTDAGLPTEQSPAMAASR
jgi:rhodanese-related sulfurtransferase